MRRRVGLKAFAIMIAACLISCSNDDARHQANTESVKTRAYSSQDEEAEALALPVEEVSNIPKNIKDKRAAAVILSNYVSIKDSLYSLDISKDDAQKIGIDTDLYMSVLKDLENANKAIKEARQRGENIDLPDIKKEYQKYKKTDKVSHSTTRSFNNGRNQYASIS